MVFANKYLVGDRYGDKDISFFVAWFQCIVCVVFVCFYTRAGQVCNKSLKPPPFSLSIMTSRQMLTLSCLFVGMLSFNNLCLKQVGVAFFQIARSMTLIFTVIFSAVILRKYASMKAVFCCLIVVAGFFLGVDQEKVAGTLSVKGVGYGIITSLFVSLVGIFTKRALDIVDKDSVKLTYYNNFNAAVLFIVPVLASNQVYTVMETNKFLDPYFWVAMGLSGVLGFLIAWASALQIHYTSPVTHHVSNNAKSVVQTVIAVMYYQENKPWLWWVSCLLVITGAFCYAIVKMREEEENKRLAEAPSAEKEKNISKV